MASSLKKTAVKLAASVDFPFVNVFSVVGGALIVGGAFDREFYLQ